MRDDFTSKLQAGSAEFAEQIRPRPAGSIRARGEQRRRHQALASVITAVAIVAGIAGGALAAANQGHHHTAPPITPPTVVVPPTPTRTATPTGTPTGTPTATPSVSPTGTTRPSRSTTKSIQVGHLVLEVPNAWRVTYDDGNGDYTVSTGTCAGDDLLGAAAGSPCPAFSVIAGAGATNTPVPGKQGYSTNAPYNWGNTGVTGCPGKRSIDWLRFGSGRPYSVGLAAIANNSRTADYTVWQMGCHFYDSAKGTYPPASSYPAYFQQRDWYLPISKVLVVDEYSIPELTDVLAAATWK